MIERIGSKIAGNPGVASNFGAIYKFVLDGADGGTWLVNLKDAPGARTGDGPCDCTISLSAKDFVDLLEGRANGQQLYFQGKLRIDGNLGLALKLQNLADLAK
ncbi:MAG TPA: SCP2 sterol-binding domain-containing protein [Polyangiaceae bacterium]|nr:SCP2 sterol-binding domain-containing protein [Polyangiaceae bacterium]